MSRFGIVAALVAVLLASNAAAQEREVRSFAMAGPWALDAGDDYCRLAGTFTNGADSIAFALERNRADNSARLVLVGDAIRPFRNADTIGYAFQPGGESRPARFVRSETGEGQAWFNLGQIAFGPAGPPQFPPAPYDRAAELAFASGVNALLVDDGLQTPVRIETGPMRGPVEALQACADDLLRVWGLDFAAHRTMTRPAAPAGPAFEWLRTGTLGFGDFPLLAGANNPVRVMVSADGMPTACHVHWPTLGERKNASICEQLMENARFTPALDAAGHPMASYWMVEPFLLMRPMGGRGR